MGTGEHDRINSLTGLRFLMILTVVICHMEFLKPLEGTNLYSKLFTNGGTAVCFFFVLSGFGLTYSAFSNQKFVSEKLSFKNSFKFAWSKVKKWYLLYVLTMIAMIPMRAWQSHVNGQGFMHGLMNCILYLEASLTLLQSAAGVSSHSHILNSACWFVSTLTILYLIYPVLEKFNRKAIYGRKKLLVFLLFVVVLIRMLVQWLFTVIEERTIFNALVYVSPYSRVFDFMAGILICDIYKTSKKQVDRAVAGTIKEILVLAAVIAWWIMKGISPLNTIIEYAIELVLICGLIYVFALEEGKLSRILSKKAFVVLGNASMYIYLLHYPIRMNLYYWLDFFIESQLILNTVTIIGIVVLTTIGTIICYKVSNRKNYKYK